MAPVAAQGSRDITELLDAAGRGDAASMDELYARAYEELRRIARRQLAQRASATLQTTVLVHETYLKLFREATADVRNRAHFYALCARAMRQILVDHFRARQASKRGDGVAAFELRDDDVPVEFRGDLLLGLDEALSRLAGLNPRLARVVECRFFGGMTQEETAAALGITDRTVRSDWRKARAFLARELAADG